MVQSPLPWVETPQFSALLAQRELDEATRQLLSSYHEQGYLVFDPEIPAATLDAAIADLDGHYAEDGRLNQTRRVQDGWKDSQAVTDIAAAPKVLALLRLLYEREPFPFQTLNFNLGSEQRTHADTVHFHSFPPRFMCGVWVALEDADADNGPLRYYPGSHRMPAFDLSEVGLSGADTDDTYELYSQYEDQVAFIVDSLKLKPAYGHLKKGQALIWSANLLHGGSPIEDPQRTRYSQVTHYYFDGCNYYTPLGSAPYHGAIHHRRPLDVRTGKPRKTGAAAMPRWYAAFSQLGYYARKARARYLS